MHIWYIQSSPNISWNGHSGSSRHIQAIVSSFINIGHTVEVFFFTKNSASSTKILYEKNSYIHLIQIEDAKRILKITKWIKETHLSLFFAKKILDLHKKKADFIYERYGLFNFAGYSIKKKLETPFILEVNSPIKLERQIFEGYNSGLVGTIAEKKIFGKADSIIAISNIMKNYICEKVSLEENKIVVIHNGVDLNYFKLNTNSEKKEVNQFYIGYWGSFKEWHGIKEWLSVFKSIHIGYPNIKGIMIGDGPLFQFATAWIKDNDLSEAITCTGYVEHNQIYRYIKDIDILLAPYPNIDLFYFSPLKFQECISIGIPIITTKQGDISNIIGTAGITVEPNNVECLSSVIVNLMNNPALLHKLKQSAIAQRKKIKDWDDIAKDITSIAYSLINK